MFSRIIFGVKISWPIYSIFQTTLKNHEFVALVINELFSGESMCSVLVGYLATTGTQLFVLEVYVCFVP